METQSSAILCTEQKPGRWFSVPGEASHTQRLAKIITVPAAPNRSPDASAHCFLVPESPRKTQHSQALDAPIFTHTEKRQSKISFSTGCRASMASGSLQAANTGRLTWMHASCATGEELAPPLEYEVPKAKGMVRTTGAHSFVSKLKYSWYIIL